MSRIARKVEVKQIVEFMLQNDAKQTAGNNQWISRAEQRHASNPLIQAGAQQVRVDGGPGVWVSEHDAASAAMQRVLGVLRQVNQPSGPGHSMVSQAEIRRAQQIDQAVGDALMQAYDVVRGQAAAPTPVDNPVYVTDEPLPDGFKPQSFLNKGELRRVDGKIELKGVGEENLSPEHYAVAMRSLERLWGLVLQHRVWRDDPLYLGSVGNRVTGALEIGDYKDRQTAREYVIADWRDIDNAKFTFYFERLGGTAQNPQFTLSKSVFNN